MTALSALRERVSTSESAAGPAGDVHGDPVAKARLPFDGYDRLGFPTLSAELTKSFVSLWTQYAGKPPTDARTEIHGNVVTCVLADGVGDFNQSMIAPQTGDTVGGLGNPAAYKRDAVAAVVRLTRQRVASFMSSHDRDTDVATEVFTLEPSLGRGASRAVRRSANGSLPPPRASGT